MLSHSVPLMISISPLENNNSNINSNSSNSVNNNYQSHTLKVLQEFLSRYPRSSVEGQLHLRDLFVNILHELDDEIHQLVLVHLFSLYVRDEETDVVPFNGFTSQHQEVLSTQHHETHELVAQDLLDFVRLFHSDTDTNLQQVERLLLNG